MLRTACNDSQINLCYWDVRLDSQLPNPCESALFTDTYFGNENGPVITGPYANKQCVADCLVGGSRALSRQCGGDVLSTGNDIWKIINASSYTEMAMPLRLSLIEDIHGYNHMFIGGQMGMITCSPCDLAFYGLHCFFDMLARVNIQNRSADVYQEYPQALIMPPFHRDIDRMMPFYRTSCVEGLVYPPGSNPYVPPVVTCNGHDACGSKALWCNSGRCMACVRRGAVMMTGWPDRACFIENCGSPAKINGTCGCAP